MNKEEKFTVSGMACQGCVNNVTTAIESLPGIEKVEVSLDKKEAFVIFDPEQITLNEIKEKNGYDQDS